MRHLVACLLGCERGHRLPSDHRQGGPSATGDVRLARSYVSMTTAVGRSESVRAKGRWYQVSSERIPKQSSTITLALDIDDLRRRGVSDPFHILVGCRSLTDRGSHSSRRRLTDPGATDGPEREPCAPPPLVRCHKRTDASFDLGLAAAHSELKLQPQLEHARAAPCTPSNAAVNNGLVSFTTALNAVVILVEVPAPEDQAAGPELRARTPA